MDWKGLHDYWGPSQPNTSNENTIALKKTGDDMVMHDVNDSNVEWIYQTFVCKLSCI